MSINITASTVEIISAFATLFTCILTGIYIWYTRKTFLEMKKQTDNQIRAYLFTSILVLRDQCEVDPLLDVRKKYDDVILKLLPDQPKSDENIFIELKNRGKTDICWWKISLNVNITVGEYLSDMHIENIEKKYIVEYSKSNQTIQPETSIKVCLGFMGYIPKAIFTWTIEYKDIYGNLYKEFTGDREYIFTNQLIFGYKKSN